MPTFRNCHVALSVFRVKGPRDHAYWTQLVGGDESHIKTPIFDMLMGLGGVGWGWVGLDGVGWGLGHV